MDKSKIDTIYSNFNKTNVTSICLCADDYGMSKPINQGILRLVQENRLTAVSCMTQSPLWQIAGKNLMTYTNQTDIGLHFNLTQAFSHPCQNNYQFSLSQIMLKAWLRQLSVQKLWKTFQYQWDSFIAVMGVAPNFIDGHQHIHQFPMVREVLLAFLEQHNFKGWVRGLHGISLSPYTIKAKVLQQLGAKSLEKLCQASRIRQNPQFLGVYDFGSNTDYVTFMQNWLSQAQDGAVLMCHPAQSLSHSLTYRTTNNKNDPIFLARLKEYQYLISDDFIADLSTYCIQLLPLSQISIPKILS